MVVIECRLRAILFARRIEAGKGGRGSNQGFFVPWVADSWKKLPPNISF